MLNFLLNVSLYMIGLALVMAIGWLLIKSFWKRKSSVMGAVASWIPDYSSQRSNPASDTSPPPRRKSRTSEPKPPPRRKSRTSEPKPLPAFQMRVSRSVPGQVPPVFVVEIKGRKPGPKPASSAAFYLHIFDMESRTPVHVSGSSHTEIDGTVFQRTILPRYLGGGAGYSGWREIAKIPVSQLNFPWKGGRSLQFRLIAMGTANGANSFKAGICLTGRSNKTYKTLKKEFQYTVRVLGYLDPIEFDEGDAPEGFKSWCLTIELATHVAYADRKFAKTERAIIQNWVKKKLDSIDSAPARKAAKSQINRIMQHSKIRAGAETTDVISICTSMRECGEVERLQALKLCIDVAKADKKATTAEFTAFNEINKELDLPKDKYAKFRVWITEWLLELGVKGVRPINHQALLDVTYGEMPKKELISRLNNEAVIWYALTSDDNKEYRELAEMMVDIIGRFRKGLDDDDDD